MRTHLHLPKSIVAITAATPFLMAPGPVEISSVPGANLQRPAWSSDGTRVSFEANYHEKKAIETYVGDSSSWQFSPVVTASGGNSLTSGFQRANNAGRVTHELSWGPPQYGRYIYSATNARGDYDIYMSQAGPVGASPSADGGGAWSPDGTKIVFTSSRSGDGDLYLVDINKIEAPPLRLTFQEEASEVYANWSPDGQQIVYVTHSQHGDNLWWLPSITHQPIRLTRSRGSHTRPTFSPNGRDVAYYIADPDTGRLGLHMLTIGAPSAPKRIAHDVVANTAGPVWSPDGRYIIYALNDDDKFDPLGATSIRNPGTFRPFQLGTVGHSDVAVTAGPNGEWRIVYVAQGEVQGKERTYKRLYTTTLPRP